MNSKQSTILSVLVIFFATGLILLGSGFADGLTNGKKNPAVVNIKSSSPVYFETPGYQDPAGSGCACCGGAASGSGSSDKLVQAENVAVAYYAQKYPGSGKITTEAFDSGCHVEVSIYIDGVFVKKLAVYGDVVTEV